MNRFGAADCRWPAFTYSSEALTMISPVDPVRRFYDAMGVAMWLVVHTDLIAACCDARG